MSSTQCSTDLALMTAREAEDGVASLVSTGGTEFKRNIPLSISHGPRYQLDELVHHEQDRQIRGMVSPLMLKTTKKS